MVPPSLPNRHQIRPIHASFKGKDATIMAMHPHLSLLLLIYLHENIIIFFYYFIYNNHLYLYLTEGIHKGISIISCHLYTMPTLTDSPQIKQKPPN